MWRFGLGSDSPFWFGLCKLEMCVLGSMPRHLLMPGVVFVLLGLGRVWGQCPWHAVLRIQLVGLRHEMQCAAGLGLC